MQGHQTQLLCIRSLQLIIACLAANHCMLRYMAHFLGIRKAHQRNQKMLVPMIPKFGQCRAPNVEQSVLSGLECEKYYVWGHGLLLCAGLFGEFVFFLLFKSPPLVLLFCYLVCCSIFSVLFWLSRPPLSCAMVACCLVFLFTTFNRVLFFALSIPTPSLVQWLLVVWLVVLLVWFVSLFCSAVTPSVCIA